LSLKGFTPRWSRQLLWLAVAMSALVVVYPLFGSICARPLIDELHLAIRPVLLGSGEHLFNGIDTCALGYKCEKYIPGERAAHVFLKRA
jgi:hypothetical protein